MPVEAVSYEVTSNRMGVRKIIFIIYKFMVWAYLQKGCRYNCRYD